MATKRVLVVDDEPRILNFVRVSLNLAGYEVLTAADGEEALRLARQHRPDIVLLDIVMEPLSGFEVLERLRVFSPQVPVIVFSARRPVVEQARQCGANDFITKPFKPGELERKIAACLGKPSS